MDREYSERLVDGALARALEPHSVEPRAGFEERLLANLAAQPERRPWWRWIWVPAVAAVVVVAIVVGVRIMGRNAPHVLQSRQDAHTHDQAPVIAHAAPVQPPATAIVKVRTMPKSRRERHVQLARATGSSTSLPKQDVFPTPVPITDEERLLLALVHRRPQEAKDIAAEQEANRERIQREFDTGYTTGEPATAQQMRFY